MTRAEEVADALALARSLRRPAWWALLALAAVLVVLVLAAAHFWNVVTRDPR